MFDISWGEMVLLGGVALVVIGPKDLPRALRAMGQATGKLRRMAGEFQQHFHEAMRDADLEGTKGHMENLGAKVRSMAHSNPFTAIRDEIHNTVLHPPPPTEPQTQHREADVPEYDIYDPLAALPAPVEPASVSFNRPFRVTLKDKHPVQPESLYISAHRRPLPKNPPPKGRRV